MPQRNFDDAFWGDDFVQSLEPNAKLLHVYLWTNKACNAAGLYHITTKTITFETGLKEELLTPLFLSLNNKIKWYPKHSVVWVKNFIKHQSKSPQFIISAAKCLNTINNSIIKEFLDYNKSVGILIPYDYPTHTLSIPYPYKKESFVVDTNIENNDIPNPYPMNTLTIPPNAKASANAINNNNNNGTGVLGGENDSVDVVVKIYESNIGVITPMIAEQLKDIAGHYPKGWFEEAVKEACKYNVRNLSYIMKILVNWETKGFKNSSTKSKFTKENNSKFGDGWK